MTIAPDLRPYRDDYRPAQRSLVVMAHCRMCGLDMIVPRGSGARTCQLCKVDAVRRHSRRYKAQPHNRAWKNAKRRMERGAERPTDPHWPRAMADRWAYYGGRCYLCGDEATTWDHVKPMTRGGHPTLPSNLRPACHACNSRKGGTWVAPGWGEK